MIRGLIICEQLDANNLPRRSVKRDVEAGLLSPSPSMNCSIKLM
jgi:hypothetical protein